MKIALCQCITCHRYLAKNRNPDGSNPQVCEECRAKKVARGWLPTDAGLPLAKIRGTLTDPLSLECLALLSEECGEVIQRNGKIQRWGWEASFDGTTQQHKLETELGDVLAAMLIAAYNGQITLKGVLHAADAKLVKLREDAAGPRQRLLHAEIPVVSATALFGSLALHHMDVDERRVVLDECEALWCRDCGYSQPADGRRCRCSDDGSW